MLPLTVSLLLLSTQAVAWPSIASLALSITRCNTTTDVVDVPPSQTLLPANSSFPVSFVALGIGVQNYTCGSTGTFT
jgi:hypothetical protein